MKSLFVLFLTLISVIAVPVESESNVEITETEILENVQNQLEENEKRIVPSEQIIDENPQKGFEQFFGFALPESAVIEKYEYCIYDDEPNYFAKISYSADVAKEINEQLLLNHYTVEYEEYVHFADYLEDYRKTVEWWDLTELSEDVVIYEGYEEHYTKNCKCLGERQIFIKANIDGTMTMYAVRVYPHFDY